MTPPRPTAPTAAELRDRFVRKLEVHLASLSAAADAREDLDRLVAAVRAEALEEAAKRCVANKVSVRAGGIRNAFDRLAAELRALVSK